MPPAGTDQPGGLRNAIGAWLARGELGAHRGQAIKPEATIAAEMAIAAATGHEYRGNPTQRISNGSVGVPSVLLKPIAVTRENVANVIIAGGF